ncbi:MAG: NUDIX domain-containing protein [bacterium]
MKKKYEKFHIGVNVFIVKNKKLLLGKRKGAYGAGTWALPGGHLEYGERMEETAARELGEETGLKAKKFVFANLVNDLSGNQHYLQIGFLAKNVDNKEPILKEPDRCDKWEWFNLNHLPKKIFPAHIKQIKAFRENKHFGE